MLYFLADPRLKRYRDDLEAGTRRGYVSSVNLSEFYYKTCQKLGKATADIRYYQMRNTRLEIVETYDELSRVAGVEKCRQPHTLSLADCHALALAKRLQAILITTDGELAKAKDVRTLFLDV